MARTRSQTSPLVAAPRGALVIALVLWAVTFVLGFSARAASGWLTSQLAVDRALNAAHTPALDVLAKSLDRLDSTTVVAACLAVLAVLTGLFISWLRALAAVLIAGGGWLFCLIPKAVVAEPRPPLDAIGHPLGVTHATLSFPSGHTVFAVTLTSAGVMVCRHVWSRVVAGVVGILFIAAVGWSRMYVGAHYPSDILGALLAGIAGALLIAWLWNLLVRSLLPLARARRTSARSDGPVDATTEVE